MATVCKNALQESQLHTVGGHVVVMRFHKGTSSVWKEKKTLPVVKIKPGSNQIKADCAIPTQSSDFGLWLALHRKKFRVLTVSLLKRGPLFIYLYIFIFLTLSAGIFFNIILTELSYIQDTYISISLFPARFLTLWEVLLHWHRRGPTWCRLHQRKHRTTSGLPIHIRLR